ncbi:amino acid ABC transporter permease [Uliginosibacterium sediminicola]|uniref:Amino acid ABC transporter permease n=1 Tax=Uliginosibacterium sediminicola TaxID=2024550 RepID=A0ABU9Z111_9RHOO
MNSSLLARWPHHLQTLLWLALAVLCLIPAWQWGLTHAVFGADAEACRAARGVGACWGVLAEKHRLLLFGRYPYAEQWRPLLASLLIILALLGSCWPRLWRPALVGAWLLLAACVGVLMYGGILGLARVPSAQWGGLPLTLIVAISGTVLALPLACLLALGRRSQLPLLKSLCASYIELVRGVPLISLLFMAAFLFPLLLPQAWHVDMLPRVIIAIALFAAAYLAEVIRGGLQAVSATQYQSALALGMRYSQAMRYIVLPQAFRAALPALISNFVGIFKDTSLISIVSLHELTGALSLALGGDPDWRPFYLEAYLFIALVYWAFCYGISRFGQALETRLRHGQALRLNR